MGGHDASSIQGRWERKELDARRIFFLLLERNVRLDEDGDWGFEFESSRSEYSISPKRGNKVWTNREQRGRDRTGATVATIKNSRNSGGSVATSFYLDYLFLSFSVRPVDDDDDEPRDRETGGRSDHDPSDLVVEGTTTRVTWWSK